jgi:putative PIN family toxin of toxin-antitoxin system
MRKLKITLDTNVLISAMFWSGVPHRILEECKTRNLKLALSPDILTEFKEALIKEEKFEQTEKTVSQQVEVLIGISSIVIPKEKIQVIKKDPNDNMILECAVAGNSDYIVSGDEHLLELKEFRGIKIVTPREFVEILEIRR